MIKNKKILIGFMDTRSNEEDLALTPYIGLVYSKGRICQVYGLSFTWFYYSLYIALAINLPKKYPNFKIFK
jgi:hypothetical protein